MTVAVLIVVAVVLVLGFGLLIFFLMRRSQKVVPDAAGRNAAHRDRAVAVDDEGRPITESQADGDAAQRDDAAFEGVLKEELKDLGR